MDIFDEDILSLWRSLQNNDVKYIMIGGFATSFHGYNRATAYIDIWILDTIENRKNFRKALMEQGSGDYDVIETMDFIPGWTDFQLNFGFKLDVMTSVKGLENIGFDECFKFAVVAEIQNIKVRFLHLNHLITCKKATGRPKDLLDVEELEKIKKI
jgi:hypothetical protein